MVPKLADFALSKMMDEYLSRSTQDKPPYWPPEYMADGRVASKAFDVFSLGVVMTEIVTGKCYTKSSALSPEEFFDRAEKNWRRLQDTYTGSKVESYCQQVKRCCEIAFRCMNKDQNIRPNVVDIIHVLNRMEDMDVQDKAVPNFQQLFAQYVGEISRLDAGYIELDVLESMIDGRGNPCLLHFPILKLITNNFSNKLRIGCGGCGEVYKGILRNGFIAVKKLFNSHTIEDNMFHQEVKSMMMVLHQNIVRLFGYCSRTEETVIKLPEEKKKNLPERVVMAQLRERLLCFEYISKGSLESYLTDELTGLEWHTRYKIIRGICDGLHHLHKEKRIIHMDLKPANILLDDGMVPKITDFGLSRIDEKSKTMSAARLLSLGYCAQEYMHDGKFSAKLDIYSLGVIIIELVTGTKKEPNITNVLRRWRHRWSKSAKHSLFKWYQQVATCLCLARRCMNTDPIKRPHIWDIIYELDEIDSMDEQPYLSTDGKFVCANDANESCIKISGLEDMLGVEPLEERLLFELNKKISFSIQLTNDTDDCFAFNISTTSLRPYNIYPSIDIVRPRSSCSVIIELQPLKKAPHEECCKEDFVLLSTRVYENLKATDITSDMFDETPNRVVDKVNLTVVLDVPQIYGEW